MSRRLFIFLAAAVCVMSGCSRRQPIVVGSKDSTEQKLLAEITAQFLERQLPDAIVQRRFGLGDTRTVQQALLNNEIGLYPEYTGLVVTELLKETASDNPTVVLERARMELKRISLLEFLAPFGFESRNVLVIRAGDGEKLTTASDAANSKMRWKVGLSYEFQNKDTGLPSLNTYRLEMGAPLRSMKAEELFKALANKDVDLIVTTATDGHLTSGDFKILEDDQKAFPPMTAGLA